MPLEDIRKTRIKKLTELKNLGFEPYPAEAHRTHAVAQVLKQFSELSSGKKELTLAGRIRSRREHGGAIFADLEDESGKIQFYVKQDEVGERPFAAFRDLFDIGDFAEVSGTLFETKTGEKTLLAKKLRMLAKSLRPLPEKWHGLKDIEERYRKKYLDILFNPSVKEVFIKGAEIIKATHEFFQSKGYVEVDTPILQPIYGGGLARPFKTHHNALDIPLYLRISDELYLKRLIVAGFEKVYEICKDFRNEGIDRHHNPEFTLLEAQTAYQDYSYTMSLVENYYEFVVKKVAGSLEVKYGEVALNFKKPWPRFAMEKIVKERTGFDFDKIKDVSEAKNKAKELGIPKEKIEKQLSAGEILGLVFEEKVQPELIQPTIVYDYPVETSPLAKKSSKDPRFAERFEHFILGQEHGNHYTELNDPIDLHQRFIEEAKRKKAGFEEAHQTDNDFLEAVEYGMPPATGLGVSIDRLVMVLTGSQNIRDVILFPLLRPKDA